MRATAFRKHCNDEDLIAHLDGELPRKADDSVSAHLKACWRCRARLVELEEQALALARLLETDSFPDPQRVAEAKTRFCECEEQFERMLAPVPQFRLLAGRFGGRLAVTAVCAAACMAVLGLWSYSREAMPKAGEIIARTQKVESALFQKPVHQAFRVEISQIRPIERRCTSRLAVWSEPDEGRFASRWMDAKGTLKYAAWRPGEGREYIYSPAVAAGAVKRAGRPAKRIYFTDLAAHGLDPEQLETGFMGWLESRRWRPISFAFDLAYFASQDGVALRAERARSEDGTPLLRLSAHRRAVRLTAELIIEVEANTYRPRLQKVRFETAGQTVEVNLIAERVEVLTPARLAVAVFEPDIPFVRPEQPPIAAAPPLLAREASVPPSPAQAAAIEMEVRYALHRTRACLGEPIEIVRDLHGNLLVRGMAGTPERKAQLLSAIAELKTPLWLKLDITTIAEAMSAAPPREGILAPQERPISTETFPLEDQLQQYFRTQLGSAPSAGEVQRRIAQFADQAVSISQAALREAWALRRLAHDYGPGESDKLQPQSRWLLEVMVRDHLAALQAQVQAGRGLLEPVLSEIVGSVEPPAPEPTGDSVWSGPFLGVFDASEQMHSRVLALFAGAGLAEAPTKAAKALLEACLRLESNTRQAEARVAAEFSGGPKVASAEKLPGEVTRMIQSHLGREK